MAAVAGGSLKALFSGIRVGAYLAFSAVGAETAAATNSAPNALVGIQFLPLPWAGLTVVSTALALRFALSRIQMDPSQVRAFVGKLAVGFGIVMAILASVLSLGDSDRPSTGFAAEVSGGEAWAYSTLLVGLAGLIVAQLYGARVVPDQVSARARDLSSLALDGARAFALLTVVLGALAIVASIVVVDSGTARLNTLLSIIFMGLTFGVVAAAYAMGAAIELAEGHTSLFHFGFPPDFEAGAAPAPFFVLLALAPAVVAWTVWQRLERERPTTEQDVMRTGFVVAIAFAVVGWVTSLLSRVVLVAVVTNENFESGEGTFLAARPSVTGVLGLSLLWAIVGGLGAAFYWASTHGVRWKGGQEAPAAPPVVRPHRQAARPLEQTGSPAFCSNCGTQFTAGARFCTVCGAPTVP